MSFNVVEPLSLADELARRGYTHTKDAGCCPGQRAISRNGRVKTRKNCFACWQWLEAIDRKLATLAVTP